MNKERFNEILLRFLDASPTPFHATANMAAMLKKNGFEPLEEADEWQLEAGKKYYVVRNDSSIIAFTLPSGGSRAYTMLGAHTDSPNLRLKPNPVMTKAGLVQLGVEPYGGVLLNPWFDRDLSIAGRVCYRDAQGVVHDALIDFETPVATIPSLAIHLDPEANKQRSVNMQTDIAPILCSGDAFDFEGMVLERAGAGENASLLSHELSLYDTQKSACIGLNAEFVASARLDNLLSCYTAMQTLCSVDADTPMLMLCSDHEEVGSESAAGASGPFLEDTLKRICPEHEAYVRMVRASVMISCDNAHALHPNFTAKHDANHAPIINRGPVVKINANQRYASNARTVARFVNAAKTADEGIQQFVTRSDMGCGSTIGPLSATRIGIDTVDVGLPQFAMHSVRECAGGDDAHALYRVLLTLAGQHG